MTNFWHACEDTLFPFKTCILIKVLWNAPFEIETPTTIQALSCFLFSTNVTFLARVSWTDPTLQFSVFAVEEDHWSIHSPQQNLHFLSFSHDFLLSVDGRAGYTRTIFFFFFLQREKVRPEHKFKILQIKFNVFLSWKHCKNQKYILQQ